MARQAGLSQPHIHNVLKGVRSLTAQSADALLSALSQDIRSLISGEELTVSDATVTESMAGVELLAAIAGPGHHWTEGMQAACTILFPVRAVTSAGRPAAVRVEADPEMGTRLGIVLIDLDIAAAFSPEPEETYLISTGHQAAMRWLRRGRQHLYVATQSSLGRPREWERIQADADPAAYVIGRIWRESFDQLRERATSR